MKRILINATHNEEIRVALCKDNHLYDFDLENRTREQKKANIYKGHITRVEPSLEAVFVEYGSARQGFLPLREIAPEYLKGNARTDNIRDIIKEGDEVIIQVEKEERGNKGAALSTYVSLAGRYLVLMPNNSKAGGISRQISGKVREEMKQIIASLSIPRGMSVIVRTAGLGKGFDDLQNDLNHLLDAWSSILEQNRTRPSPCLVHQEAGVVTRAVRDYLRDDIDEVWIDSENAYNEAAHFIASVMPTQMGKLRKYTDYEPLFARFGIERQIETAYQREVRLPSGGSIVIDQTEAMVAIDINSAKSTKGSDVAETAYHTNLEAADEIARQLRLRDMGGLIVIDFIDMNDPRHQKDVEKRLIDATRYDRARVQFAEISKFGLMEMSRQRLRPSLEEATGYICPRCHGNGMIRDLRSLALSIMRQIEQIALKERMGEIQAEVPTEIAAFLLNEKRESLVYLEQDSGTRITVLPHAHLESPNFSLHFNPDGFAPSSYDRIVDMEEKEAGDRGYEVNWQTKTDEPTATTNRWQKADNAGTKQKDAVKDKEVSAQKVLAQQETKAVAWLSNLFAPKPQARLASTLSNEEAASAIESIVNDGRVSLGSFGTLALPSPKQDQESHKDSDKTERPLRTERDDKHKKKAKRDHAEGDNKDRADKREAEHTFDKDIKDKSEKADRRKKEQDHPKRDAHSQREPRGQMIRGETLTPADKKDVLASNLADNKTAPKSEKSFADKAEKASKPSHSDKTDKSKSEPRLDKSSEAPTTTAQTERSARKPTKPDEVVLHISPISESEPAAKTVHISLDGSKPKLPPAQADTKEAKAVEAINDEILTTSKEALAINTDAQMAVKHDEVGSNSEATIDTADVLIADDSTDSTPTDDTNSLLNTARLNALAQEMNKAINDPRVVAAALREQLDLTVSHQTGGATPVETRPTSIKGTAGEFIQAVLGDDLSDDWRADFVVHFLRAMNAQQHPSTPSAQTSKAEPSVDNDFEQMFAKEFSNYGYAPLSGEYLADFKQYTTSEGAWRIGQGKTEVKPHPISERASNDPRGQHPDFMSVATESASETTSVVNISEMASVSDQAQEMLHDMGNLENAPTSDDDDISLTTQTPEPDVGQSTPAEPEPKLLVSAGDVMDKVLESAESALESLVQTLDGLIHQDDAPSGDADEEGGTHAHDNNKVDDETNKPNPASYKDMIENVSGQLLQPIGILNLVTPKKPKTTKPKTPRPPKAPAKRTSKAAQKAEVVKRKPKDDTPLSDGSSDDHQE